MRETCGKITPGTSVEALRLFSVEHDLKPPYFESGINYLGESKSFGRWTCKVEIERGVVKSSEYNFAD